MGSRYANHNHIPELFYRSRTNGNEQFMLSTYPETVMNEVSCYSLLHHGAHPRYEPSALLPGPSPDQ